MNDILGESIFLRHLFARLNTWIKITTKNNNVEGTLKKIDLRLLWIEIEDVKGKTIFANIHKIETIEATGRQLLEES